MPKFKEWYIAKHGAWLGHPLETQSAIIYRLADAFAEYVDEVVAKRIEQASWRPDVDA